MSNEPIVAPHLKAIPAPQMHVSGLLIQGEDRLGCRLIEASVQAFNVVLPPGSVCKNRSKARLLVDESFYDVRIGRQVPTDSGINVTLQRVDESAKHRTVQTGSRRWIVWTFLCGSIGIILTLGFYGVIVPGTVADQLAERVNWQVVANRWTAVWMPPRASGASTNPARETTAIDVGARAASEPRPSNETTISAVGVSLESRFVNGPHQQSESAIETSRHREQETQRRQLVQSALSSAETHRTRPLSAATLPWLFPTPGRPEAGLQRCRMSLSAAKDLQTFDSCLKSLSASEAAEATQSLRDTLTAIAVSPVSAPIVSGLPGVRRVNSTDAEVYFRIVDGEAEILRVLPADPDTEAPFHSTSDSVHRTAAHR